MSQMSLRPEKSTDWPIERIRVWLDGSRIVIEPEKAIIKKGTVIFWAIAPTTPLGLQNPGHMHNKLRWEVYFDHDNPFFLTSKPSRLILNLEKVSRADPQITTITSPPTASPGDYKYGVRVFAPDLPVPLGDEDPWIIVTS